MDKKHLALGMNPATAAHRLRVDLLFNFAVQLGHRCFRCGGELERESFSVEHKEAWLNSDDPKGKFFDLNNIAFSHVLCNGAAAVQTTKLYFSDEAKRDAQRRYQRECNARKYTPEARHARYERTGN